MNTNQLKKFAQAARTKLMEQVAAKLDYVLTHDTAELRGKAQTLQKLNEEIKNLGKKALIDKVAYTWFNRFIALRFMDANGFQPLGNMVVTPLPGQVSPQLLDEAHAGHIPTELPVDHRGIADLLDGRVKSSNPDNDVYRLLLVASCNHLSSVLPFLFERINDYTELLLPDDLTSNFSIVKEVVAGMAEEDCKEVEVIGWLYQFYISEKKDEVFAANAAVKKEDIPAATQLFTPRWIVEYMVQNTLGKLWLQNKPGSALKEHMPYYIESPSGKAEDYLKVNSVEEIKLLDQANGSGHILAYAFELFTRIYEEEGYSSSEIPQLIIEKNLYGFEIDERATQLASMVLVMKARGYYRRLFKKEVTPNILCFKDLALSEDEIKEAFAQLDVPLPDYLLADLKNMQQITNYGSLVRPETSMGELEQLLKKMTDRAAGADMFLKRILGELTTAIQQLIQLGGSFHCVVDNPPYMGSGKMNKELSAYVKLNYPDSKADLMACFMKAGLNALLPKGYLGMINQHSWMFLSSYEKLRKKLIEEIQFDTLLHLGARTFPEIGGEVVQSTSFTFINSIPQNDGIYIRLIDYGNTILKREMCIKAINENIEGLLFEIIQKKFVNIPGSPIGYWVTDSFYNVFKNSFFVKDIASPRQGIATSDNGRFLKMWFEVAHNNFHKSCYTSKESSVSDKKWYPYNKGGSYRKWYGNNEYVINWQRDGAELRSVQKAVIRNPSYYFSEGITWSSLASKFNARYSPTGFLFDSKGPVLFLEDDSNFDIQYLLGLLNSCVSNDFFKIISPTLDFSQGPVGNLCLCQISDQNQINQTVDQCVYISTLDWDCHETSWGFQQNELVRIKAEALEESYDLYKAYWGNKFSQLHKNEEELNKQFIELYGLQDELTPEVPLEDITILKEETTIENDRLIFKADEVFQQLVSYAVGCMFGRYSLDKEGLILANQGQGIEEYLGITGKAKTALSFLPDEDNIIPVLDDEWFEDDIVARFREFVAASFGEKNLRKNLSFVEECLGKDIRKYFDKYFYKDHVQRYKKRPIYWMFASPQGHFKVLVYMQRYTPDTLNVILNSYLREFIEKLNRQRKQLEHQETSGTAAEQNKARKQMDKIDIMLADCHQYEVEILYPLAGERIEIDLDDGVLVNYNKFGKAVAPIAGLNDAKTKKKVRGFDWIDTSKIK